MTASRGLKSFETQDLSLQFVPPKRRRKKYIFFAVQIKLHRSDAALRQHKRGKCKKELKTGKTK